MPNTEDKEACWMANMKKKEGQIVQKEKQHTGYLADPKAVSGLEIISSRILQSSEIFPPPCLQQITTKLAPHVHQIFKNQTPPPSSNHQNILNYHQHCV